MTIKIADLRSRIETNALKTMPEERFKEIFPVPGIEPKELSDVIIKMIEILGSERGMLPPKGLYSVVIESGGTDTYYFHLDVGRWDDYIYSNILMYSRRYGSIIPITNN